MVEIKKLMRQSEMDRLANQEEHFTEARESMFKVALSATVSIQRIHRER